MTSRLKKWLPLIRTLHIYLSLAAFWLLLLFAVTGWLMVHQERFGLNEATTTEATVSLKDVPELLAPSQRANLMMHLDLSGRLIENEPDFFQLERPGVSLLVELNQEERTALIIEEARGLSGRLFDVHRNRNIGSGATWLQDLTVALCLTVSISGFMLWLPLSRRRKAGLFALGTSLLLTVIWWLWLS